MDKIHEISKIISAILEIILNLHVLCLLIVNVTRTPARDLEAGFRYTFVSRTYRVIELMAGLISPLAKR